MCKKKENKKPNQITKKMISTIMSVCTALTKPKHDLGFEEWQSIEFRNSKINDNQNQKSWKSL